MAVPLRRRVPHDVPPAGKARQRVSALFHGNAVSLVKVAYDAPYEVYVATSTLPAGRTREDEHHQQLAGLQAGASVVPELLQYDVVELEHGPVIRTRMTNVTYPREGEDPFPLQMRFFDSPGAVRSIAESRLAIRAYDRVEVVALAAVPEGAGESKPPSPGADGRSPTRCWHPCSSAAPRFHAMTPARGY